MLTIRLAGCVLVMVLVHKEALQSSKIWSHHQQASSNRGQQGSGVTTSPGPARYVCLPKAAAATVHVWPERWQWWKICVPWDPMDGFWVPSQQAKHVFLAPWILGSRVKNIKNGCWYHSGGIRVAGNPRESPGIPGTRTQQVWKSGSTNEACVKVLNLSKFSAARP